MMQRVAVSRCTMQAMAWQYHEHTLLRLMGALEQHVTLQKPKDAFYSPLDEPVV